MGQGIAKIYRNDGPAGFVDSGAILQGGFGAAVTWADFDNDGFIDAVVTGCVHANPDCDSFTAKIYKNVGGTDNFVDMNAGLIPMYLGAVAAADYDRDGRIDLALSGCTISQCTSANVTKIYHNDGGGHFTDTNASLTGVFGTGLAWGDYNNDGYPDLLVAGSTLSSNSTKLYRNDAGVLTDSGLSFPGLREASVAWADYNNDGRLDVVLAGSPDFSSTQTSKIFRNDGPAGFTDIGARLTGVRNGSASWADYDGDNRPDLLLTGWTGAGGSASLYHNDGNDHFTLVNAGFTPVYYSSSSWADYDKDGDLDLVVAGCLAGSPCSSFDIKVYRNERLTSPTDDIPPTATIVSPVNGATFVVGQAVAASYSCRDDQSGIASCVGTVANGANMDTSNVGPKTFNVTATDRANNKSTVSSNYTVDYAFTGFLDPIHNPPTPNIGKAGRTYPVKWQLQDAPGNYISSLTAITSVHYQTADCSKFTAAGDAISTESSGASSLRYEGTSNQFLYNWQTPSTPGCYVLIVTLNDGTTHSANFQLG